MYAMKSHIRICPLHLGRIAQTAMTISGFLRLAILSWHELDLKSFYLSG